MASKAQRAVTGVPPERWAQLGKALQEWREDELGYQVRGKFAEDRFVNIRLIQDLEKNYRPGTYTKWALQDAAQAYKVTYESVLAFLHGEAGTLVRAAPGAGKKKERPAVVIEVPALPPAPMDDPEREAAARPYAEAIWKRFLDLPRHVTDPSAAQLGLDGYDADAWNGSAGAMDLADRAWHVADMRRRREARNPPPAAGATGA